MGQFTYNWIDNIPVTNGIDNMDMAWSGGLNAVQVNKMDLNADGTDDLVLFEKTSGAIKTFVYEQKGYRFAPEYLSFFPEIWGWILLRDFNGDGKKDLFTSHALGIRVFKNISDTPGTLSWQEYDGGNALTTSGFSGPVNIAIGENDLPVIDDIDNDGDLDILCFSFLGNTLQFHENIGVSADTLLFSKQSDRWGDFEDCQCGEFNFKYPCPPLGGRVEHASSRALLTIDMNGDGDKEVALSEMECSEIYILENVGSTDLAIVRNPEILFSQTHPAQLYKYPAAFLEDIDNDGDKDILVSPNTRSNAAWVMDFTSSFWFYENTGSDARPSFVFNTKSYLQDKMIELGDDAVPAFYDTDNDGDLDMVVGSMDRRSPGLRYFENTGDALSPSFQLKDIDYLQLINQEFFNIRPQFIDLDNDNTIDLAFTATSNKNFETKVYYFLNKSFWGFSPHSETPLSAEVSLGLTENAYLYDVNTDGKAEILVGKEAGNIEYYINHGDLVSPLFSLEDDTFYGFEMDPLHGNPIISMGNLDSNDKGDLIVTTRANEIMIYPDFQDFPDKNGGGYALELFASDHPVSGNVKIGTNLRPVITNLFNEDLPMLVVGTGQGGLLLFRNREAIQHPNPNKFELFANPGIPDDKIIRLRSNRNAVFDIHTITGQRVTGFLRVQTGSFHTFPTGNLTPGLYIMRVYYDQDQYDAIKFVVK
ncbi:MAG: T9SS type A sorting domain-containing protein [Cyclobacteriaceae bacterium]|nr:T9SS type A sorting domain-containing protein [Cyclobacteriaceae bacterium]